MNAYELAEIMEIHDGSQIWEHGLEIANMLRQQADRIAKLEKKQNYKYDPETGEPLIDGYPLYSGLPKRKLSDEDIFAIRSIVAHKELALTSSEFDLNFARAIEERILGK